MEETGDGDGDPGDGDGEPGDGDGEPGDGDGEPGDGDGEPGDGDGEPGDGDGEPGDGDGEPGDGDGDNEDHFEGWCDICVDPPDNSACGVVEGQQQSVSFSVPQRGHQFDIDESCAVTSVSPTHVSLDCETYNPTIDIDVVDPWVPTLAVGEMVHVIVSGWEMDLWGWNIDWRVDRADDTLALAGMQGFGGFDSIGMGAVPVTRVTDACTPECEGDVVYQELGLAFEHEGEEETLFKGTHGAVGGLEIWVPAARRLACDHWGDSGYGYSNVFISAG